MKAKTNNLSFGETVLYKLSPEEEVKKQKIFDKFFNLGYINIKISIDENRQRFIVGDKRGFVAFIGKPGFNGYLYINSDEHILSELTEIDFFNYEIL